MSPIPELKPGSTILLTASPPDEGRRIDAWLSSTGDGVSRAQVQHWLEEGRVVVNGSPVKQSYRMRGGDAVSLEVPEAVPDEAAPEDIPISIIHQDSDICVIDKPAGIVVHPAQGHRDGTLVNALLFHVRDLSGIGGTLKPGIVHRLDKGTSGLMVVSKSDRCHMELQRQFAGREVSKTYIAVVYGTPAAAEGVFDTPYGRNPRDRKKFSSKVGDGKRAVTRWRVIERFHGASLVEADLLTGRTHQIRVHFADAGFPLVGDLQYGASRRVRQIRSAEARSLIESLDRVMLHSAKLSFAHPATGKTVSFSAPMPPEMLAVIDALRKDRGGG